MVPCAAVPSPTRSTSITGTPPPTTSSVLATKSGGDEVFGEADALVEGADLGLGLVGQDSLGRPGVRVVTHRETQCRGRAAVRLAPVGEVVGPIRGGAVPAGDAVDDRVELGFAGVRDRLGDAALPEQVPVLGE